jgi:hypothetical protein
MIAEASPAVIAWWITLSAISAANIVLWIVVAWRWMRAGGAAVDPPGGRWQLVLAALFVAICAFRSFLPRAEGQRICLYESWLSSALWGRSVATVAELSLVAQWTLVLRDWAARTRAPLTAVLSWFLLPLITVAELCSWYTTLTTNFIGSVVEESLWAITATLTIIGLVAVWPRLNWRSRRFILPIGLAVAAYVVFMWSVDVPMYWSRFAADQARGKTYLGIGEGFVDAQRRRIVTRRIEDWRHEIPWMSLYFSVGVWISIGLMRAPSRDALTSARLRAGARR